MSALSVTTMGFMVQLHHTRKTLQALTGDGGYERILKKYISDEGIRKEAMAAIEMGMSNPILKYGTIEEIDFNRYLPITTVEGESKDDRAIRLTKLAKRYVSALRLAYAELSSARLYYEDALKETKRITMPAFGSNRVTSAKDLATNLPKQWRGNADNRTSEEVVAQAVDHVTITVGSTVNLEQRGHHARYAAVGPA